MKYTPITLIIFGIIIIIYPEIITILLGGLFIFIGISLLLFFRGKKNNKEKKEDYIKFGKYKIYR